jgi:hypothetical protein
MLLRSAKLTAIGNNTLTIRTFLFSLPLSAQAHACTASFLRLLFYRPPGDQGELECQWNVMAKQTISFKRTAFYQSLKSKVGLAEAKRRR